MPKIFRGTTPPPMPPSKQPSKDGGPLGKPSVSAKPGEPIKKKYSTKEQYKRYQTREDPINGSGHDVTGRLSDFKAKLRKRKEKKSSASGGGVFGSKSHMRLDILKERATKVADVNIAGHHKLEQAKAREELIARHFGDAHGKWVNKKEYEQKISQLKKDAPWMKSYNARQQAEADARALEQLRGDR